MGLTHAVIRLPSKKKKKKKSEKKAGMGSMSKDNGTLSFWEVVAKVDKDDYLYDIKQKGSFFFTFSLPQHIVFITDKLFFFLSLSLSFQVFNHRLLKILRKGTVEDRQDILKYICKEQVFISEAMVAACDIALKLHGSNRVYKKYFQSFRDGNAPGRKELANTLSMLGGGTFDEVLQNHRPDPRAQTYSGVFTHVLASQKPAATALAMHVNFRTFGVVCMHIMDALKHDLGELGLTEEDLGFFGMFAVCYSGDMNLDYTGFMKGSKLVFEEGVIKEKFNYKEFINALCLLQHAELEFFDAIVPEEMMIKYLKI